MDENVPTMAMLAPAANAPQPEAWGAGVEAPLRRSVVASESIVTIGRHCSLFRFAVKARRQDSPLYPGAGIRSNVALKISRSSGSDKHSPRFLASE